MICVAMPFSDTFFMEKKYPKKPTPKRRFCLCFLQKQAQNRCYKPTFFSTKKSYGARYARLVGSPQHTLVLASHSENSKILS